ncbi:MAG: response regulator transcription factor [Actinobacteria bacterium]|nr:response regulator transcription factor [Actinomycetota bacterium]
MSRPISVLLVDDHRMFGDAMDLLMRSEPGLRVLGVVQTAEEALDRCRESCPEVVLMDVDLPGIDGITATRMVREVCPDAAVVVITALREMDLVVRSVEAGAVGYVPKTRAADDLLETIKLAANGEMVVPDRDLHGILFRATQLRANRSESDRRVALLTDREIQVLQAVTDGLSTAEVAGRLHIAPLTVHSHVKSILAKLGVRSKLEAAMFAVRHGIVDLKS